MPSPQQKDDFFFARAATKKNVTPIALPESNSVDSQIFSFCFQHHILDRPFKSHFKEPGQDLSDLKVTHAFHANDAQFQLCSFKDESTLINVDTFFSELTKSTANPDTITAATIGPNRVVALIGKVGTGKSTFLSHLLVRQYQSIKSNQLFAFRVDVEAFAGRDADKQLFFAQLCRRLQDEVIERFYSDKSFWIAMFDEIGPASISSDRDIAATQYLRVIRAIYIEIWSRYQHRGLLLLDNIDKYYYLFDRASFSDEGAERRRSAMSKLQQILLEFSSPVGGLSGCALSVLVALRRHTLHFLQAENFAAPSGTLRFDDILGSSAFRLSPPSAEAVVASRMSLMKRVVSFAAPEHKRNDLVQSVDRMWNVWTSVLNPHARGSKAGRRMLDDLSSLMHHGHRSLVDHLCLYRWAASDQVSFSRMFRSYGPSILLFALSQRQRYSQVECRFPNLFLVRGELGSSQNEIVPEGLRAPHRQTYWLKFLILDYVFQQKKLGRLVTRDSILSVFARGSVLDGFYEKHLVELVLGSLCQVDGSYCIDPEYGTGLEGNGVAVNDILLTSRGRFLVERFCFSFEYLQLVVEDYMLELPTADALREFSDGFSLPDNQDYSYLVKRYEDYASSSVSMVKFKGRLVARLLLLLEVALEYETRRRFAAFEILGRRGLKLPDFSEVRASVAAAVSRILTQLSEPVPGDFMAIEYSGVEIYREPLEQFFGQAYLKADV